MLGATCGLHSFLTGEYPAPLRIMGSKILIGHYGEDTSEIIDGKKWDYGTDNLWQDGKYNWVGDEGSTSTDGSTTEKYHMDLKQALVSADKINPAVRIPADHFSVGLNSEYEEEDKNSNDEFEIGERSTKYYLGDSLQFIAKHPDALYNVKREDWDKDKDYLKGDLINDGALYRALENNKDKSPDSSPIN